MNNLQANDYNWTVSQKTASYVLVAADAGTRIEMNSGSATTVTVNTGLFTAGDTLFIQNIGAGACTVTAGTATVNKATAGSLTLSQYQGGTLYFVSASSAIFFADAGYTPPLTTKGDLFGFDTAAARVPIGANNTVLTADSTQALGLKWATVSSTPTANACAVYLSAAQAITSGNNTFINWDAEYFDTNSYHSTSTNTDRLVVPQAGKYQVYAGLTWQANATLGRQMEIRRYNSSNVQQETRIFYWNWTITANATGIQGGAIFDAASGDYFIIVARQDSGSTLNLRPVTNGDTFAFITLLGA